MPLRYHWWSFIERRLHHGGRDRPAADVDGKRRPDLTVGIGHIAEPDPFLQDRREIAAGHFPDRLPGRRVVRQDMEPVPGDRLLQQLKRCQTTGNSTNRLLL